jgi:hypothetical protein
MNEKELKEESNLNQNSNDLDINNDNSNQILNILYKEIKELKSNYENITTYLKQQHQENIKINTVNNENKIEDPSSQSLTVRSAMELIHEAFNLYAKTQDQPTSNMDKFHLAVGQKVVSDTLDKVSQNVFAKPIAKEQSKNIKSLSNGV